MIAYQDFLAQKVRFTGLQGFEPVDMHPEMKPFQRDLTRWSLRKGRAALFTATGTGKTFMQLEWADQVRRYTRGKVVILAPLSVVEQTKEEAVRWGYDLTNITITNYEQLHKIATFLYKGVVLDESSILKNFTGKTRNQLIAAFSETPYRLCCTATPAPNDIAEIANHAEFLGIQRRVEMLAEWFVHDESGWRLKKHAAKNFYKWLASWSMSLTKPSDLGYDDEGYDLPPLNIAAKIVRTDYAPPGRMFAVGLKGVQERASVRKLTAEDRVEEAVRLVNADPDHSWLVWCGLNSEQEQLHKRLKYSVSIEGKTPEHIRQRDEKLWRDYEVRTLITKPAVYGFGMNWQHCHNMVFVGLGDSYETYYQAIRRCWRYGQQSPVNVWIILSDLEQEIYENVLRKEREAKVVMAELIENVREFEQAEVSGGVESDDHYITEREEGPRWQLWNGDSAELLTSIATNSIDLSVTSIPFSSLYTYSPSERDLGNSKDGEFWQHMGYISKEWLRVTKPGRVICVHVQQLTTTLSAHGVIGIRDFRGETIRHFTEAGFIFQAEVCIDKDPQAVAITTHVKGLAFVQLHKDRSWMRQAFADYILVFRKPGDNDTPIIGEVTNEEWITWAHPVWYGIRNNDTLNVREGRGDDDERHICPLQLGTIERCIRLWSNPDETVLDPFSGLGSVAYVAVKTGRKGIGIELNPNYHRAAVKNLERVTFQQQKVSLFDGD